MNTSPDIQALLDSLHAAGGEVYARGGTLKLLARGCRIPPALRYALEKHGDELLDYLQPYGCVRCGRYDFPLDGLLCIDCISQHAGHR